MPAEAPPFIVAVTLLAFELSPPALEAEGHGIEPIIGICRTAGEARLSLTSRTTCYSRGDLTIAHQEGYQSVEHLRRYTTLGMGTDQERRVTSSALAIEARSRGVDISAVGSHNVLVHRLRPCPSAHSPDAASEDTSARPAGHRFMTGTSPTAGS